MRKSGILLHISSLPSEYGIGTFGKEAYRFVDFLEKSGQAYWQILPVGVTGYGDSPYQSFSSFAGNPYFIDLDLLCKDGLLKKEDYENIDFGKDIERVDYGTLYSVRYPILRKVYANFKKKKDPSYDIFCAKNREWIYDFALFMALKDENNGASWQTWESPLKKREKSALEAAKSRLADDIEFYCVIEFLFFRQWFALKDYANKKGIKIIGDVPIYVSLDSADVWANPKDFELDEDLAPVNIAGCPPDDFSADGQRWGNPLYNWKKMKLDGFSWWCSRVAFSANVFDVLRIDHFRGFEAYWSIPATDKTAKNGKWVQGPGIELFEALEKNLGKLPIIAEDLGFLTAGVKKLLKQTGFPGMKVLEFAFDSREPSEYLPQAYLPNSVCYTATHDNMTTRQWFDTASEEAVEYAVEYMALTEKEGYVWGMIRTAFSSVSDLCVVPMQDFLDLGAEARMNFPGTTGDTNWTWRAEKAMIAPALATKIEKLTRLYNRAHK